MPDVLSASSQTNNGSRLDPLRNWNHMERIVTHFASLASTSGNWFSARLSFSPAGTFSGSVSSVIQDSDNASLPGNAWDNGKDIDRVTILLHELGHALAFL